MPKVTSSPLNQHTFQLTLAMVVIHEIFSLCHPDSDLIKIVQPIFQVWF